jgi:hypothetical protein
VKILDVRNASRQDRLEELNLWRNAIAHQDFSHPAIHRQRCTCSASEFGGALATIWLKRSMK